MERETITVEAAQTQTGSEANDAKPCLPKLLLTLITCGGSSYDFTMPLESFRGREMTIRTLLEEMVECGDYRPHDGQFDADCTERRRLWLRDILDSMLERTEPEPSDRMHVEMHCLRDEESSPVLIAPDIKVRLSNDISGDRRLIIRFALSQNSS